MKIACDEIWARALSNPCRIVVGNQAAATALRHQLYRWREQQRKSNFQSSGAKVSEYDSLAISISRLDNGQYALHVGSASAEIVSIEDLGG